MSSRCLFQAVKELGRDRFSQLRVIQRNRARTDKAALLIDLSDRDLPFPKG